MILVARRLWYSPDRKIFAVRIAIFLFLLIAAISILFIPKPSFCADDEKLADFSLDARAKAFATYFNEAVAPRGTKLVGCTLLHPNVAGDDKSEYANGTFYDQQKNLKYTGINMNYNCVAGNAGALLSYDDPHGIVGWITAKVALASYSLSYDQCVDLPISPSIDLSHWTDFMNPLSELKKQVQDTLNDKNPADTTNVLQTYARYGYSLRDMGFDDTGSDGMHLIRWLSGGLIYMFYMLGLAVPALFGAVLTILKTMNPFTLFGLVDVSAVHDQMAGGDGWQGQKNIGLHSFVGVATDKDGNDVAVTPEEGGFLGELAKGLSRLYSVIYSFSWFVIIPLLLAFTVAGILLFKKNQNGQTVAGKIKKYAIRVIFICVGFPLMGSCYTSILNAMDSTMGANNSGMARLICKTYCDFESWAKNARLSPVGEWSGKSYIQNTIDVSDDEDYTGHVTNTTNARLRSLCLEANAKGMLLGANGAKVIKDKWLDKGVDDNSSASIGENNNYGKVDESIWDVEIMRKLLDRYMSSDFYTASTYEQAVKAELGKYMSNASYSQAITNMFYGSDDGEVDGEDSDMDITKGNGYSVVSDTDDGKDTAGKVSIAGLLFDQWHWQRKELLESDKYEIVDKGENTKALPLNLFANGGLYGGYPNEKFMGISCDGTKYNKGNLAVSQDLEGKTHSGEDKRINNLVFYENSKHDFTKGPLNVTDPGGLSTMSLFNYLNTKFSAAEMTCYSNDSSSNFVRKNHFSVNLIGTGFLTILYWFNLLCVVMCISLLGVGYALSMIFANFRRSIKIIFNMPFSMMGGLQAIAKVITFTVALIVEIVGTMFMYSVVCDFVYAVAEGVEAPFQEELSTLDDDATPDDGKTPVAPTAVVVGNSVMSVNTEHTVSNSISVGDMMLIPNGSIGQTMGISLMLLFSSAILIWFLINGLRFRKSFVKGVDEMAAKVINKFITGDAHGMPPTGGKAHSPGGSHMSGAIAGGMAAGIAAKNAVKAGADANGSAKADGTKDGSKGMAGSDGKDGDSGGGHDTQAGEAAGGENGADGKDGAGFSESSENVDSEGHSDLEDKAAAEEMDGPPTGNVEAQDGADGDGAVAEADGDGAVVNENGVESPDIAAAKAGDESINENSNENVTQVEGPSTTNVSDSVNTKVDTDVNAETKQAASTAPGSPNGATEVAGPGAVAMAGGVTKADTSDSGYNQGAKAAEKEATQKAQATAKAQASEAKAKGLGQAKGIQASAAKVSAKSASTTKSPSTSSKPKSLAKSNNGPARSASADNKHMQEARAKLNSGDKYQAHKQATGKQARVDRSNQIKSNVNNIRNNNNSRAAGYAAVHNETKSAASQSAQAYKQMKANGGYDKSTMKAAKQQMVADRKTNRQAAVNSFGVSAKSKVGNASATMKGAAQRVANTKGGRVATATGKAVGKTAKTAGHVAKVASKPVGKVAKAGAITAGVGAAVMYGAASATKKTIDRFDSASSSDI